MKRAGTWDDAQTISSDSSSSDSKNSKPQSGKKPNNRDDLGVVKCTSSEDVSRIHEAPCDPPSSGSVIPFKSWQGLGRSMKQLHGQPLHYLTNLLLKQWDQQRVGAEEEHQRLDSVVHPAKAESFIWVCEEVHRLTSSPFHLAKLWAADDMFHASIDPIFPEITQEPI
ncbi:unnamed protein product [Spirodela intermedia]|uniref:Uncharacterized protein n=1 Tax=Spirodela intermedia TaxID=51605 RepID=A0A7I8IKX1_SPIIN|nr:unnamed protein product [Spirodela intermedia]CAA6658530.1 unnamed protein product [Spirodela intermedia]